jgi:hypothetical protein
MISNDSLLNIDALAGLNEEERKLALEILRQYSEDGTSSLLDHLKYGDFEEVPVDIDTFLDDDRYLGKGLWEVDARSGTRRCTIFPYWRETLKQLFPDNLTTAYNTLILTGAIGIGKSFAAVIAQLYLLYRMLCLKDPYGYFGMQPIDKITFSMLNITLDAAQGVAWDKAQQLIQSSSWFMEHGAVNASRSNPVWQPGKHIELIFGSQNRHVVGRALFCNLTDEVNFGIGNDVEKKKAKQKKLIAQIDARMRSRFLRGTYLPTLNIIISSKDTEQAFLDSYINIKKQNESKTTLIIDEAQWVVDPRKGSPDDPGAFYVAVGNKFLAHELLPPNLPEEECDKYREKGYMLLKIPPGYREDFETNLDQALMDIAGISTSSNTKYISGVRLNQTKTDSYKNPFVKDIIEVGNNPEDKTQYANYFDLSRVSPKDMARPLFIHLDMSLSGDKTGLAGVWITGKRPSTDEDPSKDLQFKLAFSVSVKAPKGFQVSFAKTKNFVNWLRDRGFAVKGVSMDTYQSANIAQDLKMEGFNTDTISVDRVDHTSRICLPYHYLKTAIYEQRIQIYQKCDLLTDELVGLERLTDGHIDHTSDGINSKDQADGLCGALYLASKFANEYAYSYGENLDAGLDVSLVQSDSALKTQMITAFESELQRLYFDTWAEQTQANNLLSQQQRAEWERYQDIADGIIIL